MDFFNILALLFYTSSDNTFPELSIKKVNNDYTITNKYKFSLDYGYEFNNVPLYNNFIKINDNRFLYLTTSVNRDQLYFVLFNLYNNANNVKIRIFKSDIFSLFNYKIYKEIKTILYNEYLAFSASVCSKEVCTNNNNNNEDFFSIFLIFGYVNGVDSTIDISKCLSENIDSNDVSEDNNLILKLQKLGKIDNNIFGYEFSNQIKLITIPNELEFYNKLLSGEKTPVNSGDILELSHEIIQKSGITKNDQTFFLEYQLIINKPSLQKLNQYAIKVVDYPENPTVEEDYVNENNKYYSRTVKAEFKLCYEACSSCNYLGTSPSNQKCLTCLQEDYSMKFMGNCIPKGHYLDIELDEIKRCEEDAKIIIEKDTGQRICFKKDYNCPEDYPFYLERSHECIENYSFDVLLNEILHMNVSNTNVLLYDLITEKGIQNYNMNGSIIIEGDNNYVYELTNTFNDNSDSNNDLSTIDLGECENLLKRENKIDPNIPLIILKLEKTGEVASKRNIQFEVYHPITKVKLDISVCDQIDIYVPVNLDPETLGLYLDLQNYGYDLFNPNDSFYQDICAHYTTENGTDVLLADRKKYFFNDTETACQKGCEYSKYNLEKKQVKCECNVIPENNIEPEKENKFTGKMLYESFYDVLKFSNVRILKCYKLVFSFEGENGNYGSILMVVLILVYIVLDFIFFFNGIYQLKILIGKILFKNKPINDKVFINSKEKENTKKKNNKKDKKVHKHKEKFKIVKYNKKSDSEAQPPRRTTKNVKFNDNNNNSLMASERRIDNKAEENDEGVLNHTFTEKKYKLGSKTELVYEEKNKVKLPHKKQSDKNLNINKKNLQKFFDNNNKNDKEKQDNIGESINDNMSRNFSDNFSDSLDKKDNIDIVSCNGGKDNDDLNFRSIDIHVPNNNKSGRNSKKRRMYDSASHNNDLISANRLSRASSLNNSINNFMSMNNSIYNTENNSMYEESKEKVPIKRKKSKFLEEKEKEKEKENKKKEKEKGKGKEENKIVSHCCIKGNNFKDFELNELDYNEAVVHDSRGFFQYYWQLIRREHLFIFIFFVYDDFNLLSIKMSLFVFSLALDFGLNVFFFFDESMNKIYLDYGKYSFLTQVPQILYSSLLAQGIDILIRYLCLTEKDMYKIKVYSEKKDKEYYKNEIFKTFTYIKFKLVCYFIFSFFMMIFFWYLISAFCAVYKNTQIILLQLQLLLHQVLSKIKLQKNLGFCLLMI